ncbi:MAG: DegT/DnrJ/EryC1/StrS family aminotransferase [Geobacter sp.]|nr:DegT/DnrJ/EryC1/StrS family aminotransferase [Geobacter sp.]
MKRQKLIQAFPALDLRQVFTHARQDDPILSQNTVRLYASGRAGLFHSIKSLAFPPESVILVPAYHCGVEVEAVLRAGCKVDFYRIQKDLSIDLDSIRKKITPHTKGILAVHYFGFPQELCNLKQICQRRDLVLIEDCAHALYSKNEQGDWLGTKGDYGIFSMRKTVFMPNGGAVRVNRNGFVLPDKGKRYCDLSILKSTIKSALEHEACMTGSLADFSQYLLDMHQQQAQRTDASGDTADDHQRWYYDVAAFDYAHSISAVSRACGRDLQFSEVIARRRANYESLEKLLSPCLADQFVIPKLAQGVCPLCFPLFVNQRDKIAATLTARKVIPFVFGRHHHPLLDTAAFPESRFLADSILGLPVHQQLTELDMSLVAERVCTSLERC